MSSDLSKLLGEHLTVHCDTPETSYRFVGVLALDSDGRYVLVTQLVLDAAHTRIDSCGGLTTTLAAHDLFRG